MEGDEIYAGQSWQLELDPVKQTWELACKMGGDESARGCFAAWSVREGGAWDPHIAVYAVPGNHGKVGGKKSGARPGTYNWDWLLHKLVADKLRMSQLTSL